MATGEGSGRAFAAASAALFTDQQGILKWSFAGVADEPKPLRQAAITVEGQGGRSCNAKSPTYFWGTFARSETKAGLRSTAAGRCHYGCWQKFVYHALVRLAQIHKRRESAEFALRGLAGRSSHECWAQIVPGRRRPARRHQHVLAWPA
jgi:hypothetical protein